MIITFDLHSERGLGWFVLGFVIGELDFILNFHWSMSVPCPLAFPELPRSAQYVPLNIDINELNKDYSCHNYLVYDC